MPRKDAESPAVYSISTLTMTSHPLGRARPVAQVGPTLVLFLERLRRSSLALSLAVLGPLCACGSPDPTMPDRPPEGPDRLVHERRIAEVGLRHLLSHLSTDVSGWPGSFATVCISVAGKGPDEDLRLRLSDWSLSIKGSSGCAWDSASGFSRRVIDASTGEPAVRLSLGDLTWLSGRTVSLSAAYSYCELCSAMYNLEVALEEGQWKVSRCTLVARS